MTDLESLTGQVWSPSVRPLAAEAWRCYSSGATRASIALTWAAVTADIIAKLVRLADEGDAEAAVFRTELTRAQEKGISRDGVRAMQNIEATLLEKATKFELIDSIGVRELERIREDRNLCVHPSLRSDGVVYEPRAEVARGHLAVALTTLLTHPPTQGGKLLEQFTAYICDPSFVPTLPHIQATFFDRVRTATRRTITRFAAKHAVLELDPNGMMPAAEHANRMAVALDAFAQRDRELVREAVVEQRERLQLLDGGTLLRTLVRLGDQDYFWSAVDQALASRIEGYLAGPLPAADWEPLPMDLAASLALVRSAYARERLPILETRYDSLPIHRKIQVAAAHPDPYFVSAVVENLEKSRSWQAGGNAGRILVLCDAGCVMSGWSLILV